MFGVQVGQFMVAHPVAANVLVVAVAVIVIVLDVHTIIVGDVGTVVFGSDGKESDRQYVTIQRAKDPADAADRARDEYANENHIVSRRSLPTTADRVVIDDGKEAAR